MLHYPSYRANFEGAKLRNNVKRSPAIIFIASLAFFTLSSSLPFREEYKIRTVVIDPGHGGHDSGCLGASSKEKHIALAISLKLGKMIEESNPDVKVVYTRKTDVFIPLHERANIANRAKADLFICIHLNAGSKTAYGVETYVMGNHKSEDNLNVAKRENSAILLEDDYKQQYDGFDPNSPEANIIFTLFQSQFQHQSLLFASKVQDHATDFAGRFNRGVKQAGFLVLYRTAMPAVLIECGFLTHNMEEKFLGSEKGQTLMATSVFRAFREYKLDMESPGDPPSAPVASTSNTPVPKKEPVKESVKEPVKTVIPVKTAEKDSATSTPASPGIIKPAPEKETPAEVVHQPEPKTFIAIQVGASLKPESDNKTYLSKKGVRAIRCSDGYTRYVTGTFNSASDAAGRLKELKSTGTKDAFLTGFNGNQRITVKDAEEIIRRTKSGTDL
jgi:N-acetylmuramoyl-L-alanine amidase